MQSVHEKTRNRKSLARARSRGEKRDYASQYLQYLRVTCTHIVVNSYEEGTALRLAREVVRSIFRHGRHVCAPIYLCDESLCNAAVLSLGERR